VASKTPLSNDKNRRKSKGSKKGKDGKNVEKRRGAGYDVAIKETTLSPEFLESVPENIRNWNTVHAVAWLREIFADADARER
jgi:hypothetical protein